MNKKQTAQPSAIGRLAGRAWAWCRRTFDPRNWMKDTKLFLSVILGVALVLGILSIFAPADEAMRAGLSESMQQRLEEDEDRAEKTVVKTENSLGFIKYFSYSTTGNNVVKESFVGILGQVYDVSVKTYRLVYGTEQISQIQLVDNESGSIQVLADSKKGDAVASKVSLTPDGLYRQTEYTANGAPVAMLQTELATGTNRYFRHTESGYAELFGISVKLNTVYEKGVGMVLDHAGEVVAREEKDSQGNILRTIVQQDDGGIRVGDTVYYSETDSFGAVVGRLVNYTYRMLGCGEGMLYGAKLTISLTTLSVLFGLLLSVFLALGKIAKSKLLNKLCSFYIFFFRGTPLMIQLFVVYFALPDVFGFTWTGLFSGLDASGYGAFLAAVITFSLNSAAYCAEIVRAAIQSIDRGQSEAAKALGMTYGQTMRLIIIPQSIRRLIPPVANEFIMILKDASLVFVISLMDITTISKTISAKGDFLVFVPALIIYLIITWFFSFLFNKLEKKFAIYE